MKKKLFDKGSILVKGFDKLAFSVATCFLNGGYRVTLFTDNVQKAFDCLKKHKENIETFSSSTLNLDNLEIVDDLRSFDFELAIVLTSENLTAKRNAIKELEQNLKNNAIISINTESIALTDLQFEAQYPDRIIGVNWVEPAHTTRFLEILYNGSKNQVYAEKFCELARLNLEKDPYVVVNFSIRAKLMTAMIREAGYLIQNGYATLEDIDRACRNDAGYYLPFAGNFRYMDLMGTSAYGMVMKDLNPELAKDIDIPVCFKEVIESAELGMQDKKGFYNYNEGDLEKWEAFFQKFSYEVQNIMHRYPFNYAPDEFAENEKS